MKLLILKGLPGSGKSTVAKELSDKHGWKVVNKDSLRLMLDNGKHTNSNEKFVLSSRDALIRAALRAGQNVVSDDTNLAPQHEAQLRLIAAEYAAQVEVRLIDTPLEECLSRNAARVGGSRVSKKVILKMYNDFLRPPEPEPPAHVEAARSAVICDLDGTLAVHNGRDPYAEDLVEQDGLNECLATILSLLWQVHCAEIIFVSGRHDTCRDATQRWLDKHGFGGAKLLMRGAADGRRDNIVKREIYEQHILGKYNVLAVFDDRLRVCRMWHELGLPLYRLGNPDADF